MKKWKRLLLTGLAACAAMAVTASASSFDQTADTLKSMGLFAGTTTGYELDRAPTRAEAAVMLVRLLGKTEEANAEWAGSQSSFAFRDMDEFDWAQPSVHWLSVRGLAAGTSAERFSPTAPCTAQMYAAFLMRALGYSEADGDYSFDNVLAFARSRGVIDSVNCDETAFLRDHVVAASYTALASAPKSGEADLLTKLADSGAVSGGAVSAEQQKFAAYRAYCQLMQPAAGGIAMENVTSLSITGGLSLETAAVSQTALSGNRLSSQSSLTVTLPGEDPFVLDRSGYYADGRWYTEENGTKTWRAMSLNDLVQPLSQTGAVPLVLIGSIQSSGSGYSLTYSSAGLAHYRTQLDTLLHSQIPTLSGLSIDGLSAEIRVEDGALSSLSTSISASGKLSGSENAGVTIRAQQNSKISAVGDQVSVSSPSDLSSYQQDS